MGMNPKQRAQHCMDVSGKSEGIGWIRRQIGRPVHPMMNTEKLTQSQLDRYWVESIRELEKL